mmetsp:Transcript_25953/g.42583  ORF Transcript_25953/g.42583 Transcript_25953/m.42583 type:complete len:713 (-) Transcript_25953:543-2681(-)
MEVDPVDGFLDDKFLFKMDVSLFDTPAAFRIVRSEFSPAFVVCGPPTALFDELVVFKATSFVAPIVNSRLEPVGSKKNVILRARLSVQEAPPRRSETVLESVTLCEWSLDFVDLYKHVVRQNNLALKAYPVNLIAACSSQDDPTSFSSFHFIGAGPLAHLPKPTDRLSTMRANTSIDVGVDGGVQEITMCFGKDQLGRALQYLNLLKEPHLPSPSAHAFAQTLKIDFPHKRGVANLFENISFEGPLAHLKCSDIEHVNLEVISEAASQCTSRCTFEGFSLIASLEQLEGDCKRAMKIVHEAIRCIAQSVKSVKCLDELVSNCIPPDDSANYCFPSALDIFPEQKSWIVDIAVSFCQNSIGRKFLRAVASATSKGLSKDVKNFYVFARDTENKHEFVIGPSSDHPQSLSLHDVWKLYGQETAWAFSESLKDRDSGPVNVPNGPLKPCPGEDLIETHQPAKDSLLLCMKKRNSLMAALETRKVCSTHWDLKGLEGQRANLKKSRALLEEIRDGCMDMDFDESGGFTREGFEKILGLAITMVEKDRTITDQSKGPSEPSFEAVLVAIMEIAFDMKRLKGRGRKEDLVDFPQFQELMFGKDKVLLTNHLSAAYELVAEVFEAQHIYLTAWATCNDVHHRLWAVNFIGRMAWADLVMTQIESAMEKRASTLFLELTASEEKDKNMRNNNNHSNNNNNNSNLVGGIAISFLVVGGRAT